MRFRNGAVEISRFFQLWFTLTNKFYSVGKHPINLEFATSRPEKPSL
jgi:hypothetical protein